MSPRHKRWEVNGLHLHGLCWGDEKHPPLLALHGWLDNAASFDLIAPLLNDHYVVALDLTGHGLSSRRSADASYQIWDDLPEIVGVVDHLGWHRFDLMGHSRGAIISTILASVIPDRVRHLVLLDAVMTPAIPEEEFSRQLGKHLKDKPRGLKRSGRVYPTLGEAIAARTRNGLSESAAGRLATRSVEKTSEGYVWGSDPRLYGASAVKLTGGQIAAMLQSLTMPTLLLQAENGLAQASEVLENAQKHIPNLCAETVAGGHHFHMEEGAAAIARRIERFLAP